MRMKVWDLNRKSNPLSEVVGEKLYQSLPNLSVPPE